MKEFKVFDDILNERAVEQYRKARPVDRVIVHSRGGMAFESLALANAIQEDKPEVYIAGRAVGGAALLVATGGQVSIHPAGFLHLRRCVSQIAGNREQLEAAREMLEKIDESFASFLAKGRRRDSSDIMRYMEEEVWFSAQEALRAGLVDKVEDLGGVEVSTSEIRAAVEGEEGDGVLETVLSTLERS